MLGRWLMRWYRGLMLSTFLFDVLSCSEAGTDCVSPFRSRQSTFSDALNKAFHQGDLLPLLGESAKSVAGPTFSPFAVRPLFSPFSSSLFASSHPLNRTCAVNQFPLSTRHSRSLLLRSSRPTTCRSSSSGRLDYFLTRILDESVGGE